VGKLLDIDIVAGPGPDGTLSPGYVLRLAAAGFAGMFSLLLLLLVVDRAALLVRLVDRAVEFPPIIRKTGIVNVFVWGGYVPVPVVIQEGHSLGQRRPEGG
jgi:hypothetical protein